MLLTAGISEAITLSVAPNPATAGQTVTATVMASYVTGPPPCGVRIRFSAADPFTNIGSCSTPCNVPHIYTNPGLHAVTVERISSTGFCTPASLPYPVSTNVTVNCPAFSITTTSLLPAATYGTPYSRQIQISGGLAPITYSIIGGSLPPGLGLNSSTGVISGTPTSSGNYSFTVRAEDSCIAGFGGGQTVDRVFSLQVNCPALSYTSPNNLPNATVSQPYSYQMQTSGGVLPVAWSKLVYPAASRGG